MVKSWMGAGAALLGALLLAQIGMAKTVVTYWYPWNGTDGSLIVKWADAYNQTHPDVEIKPVMVDGGGVGSGKLTSAVLGGDPPDLVLYWGQDQTGSLAAGGVISPLTAFEQRSGLKADQFYPPAWHACTMNGQLYCVPEMVNVTLLYYNTDMFEKAGLNPQSPPSTLDELDSDSKKLTITDAAGKVTQVAFLPLIGQGPEVFWAHDFGGRLWDDATGRPTLIDPRTLAAAQWMQDYGQEFKAGINQYKSWNDYLKARIAALQLDGEWQLNGYRSVADLHYGVAPPAHPQDGNPNSTYVSGNVWFIPKGAKHAQAAFDFLTWMSQSERSGSIADTVYNISPVRDAATHQQLLRDPLFAVAIHLLGSPNAISSPVTPFVAKLDQAAHNAFYSALYGTQPAKAALQKAQTSLSAYIEQQETKR